MRSPQVLKSLCHNLGPEILDALERDDVLEIMLNDDGQLWIDSHDGMACVGSIGTVQARGIITLTASLLGTTVSKESPIVEGELPLNGARFEGLLPPVVRNPCFTIRKKAVRVFSLEDYVQAGSMPPKVKNIITDAIQQRSNILVVGGTSSGKTTLTNAILSALADLCPHDRLVIIEDTIELQCTSANRVELRTSPYTVMQHLLKATMRLRPDRIIVGEVRGREALELLKAWNTGHPGGICTIHANDAYGGLIRLEQLIAEASESSMQHLICEAVDLVVFLERVSGTRIISQVARIEGFENNNYRLINLYERKG